MTRRLPFPRRRRARLGALAGVVMVMVAGVILVVLSQSSPALPPPPRHASVAPSAAFTPALAALLRQGTSDTTASYWQKPSTTLEAAASGANDQQFRALGVLLVKDGFGRAVLDLGREMTGGWYNWSERNCLRTEADCYVLAWRHAVATLRSVPGQHFRFLWTVFPGTAAAIEAWPGAGYVDMVGTDVYDWYGGPQSTYPHTASGKLDHNAKWQQVLTEPGGLNWLAKLSQLTGKPVVIPEWGLDFHSFGGQDDPAFVTRMLSWLHTHHAIGIYWAGDHVVPDLAAPAGPLLTGLGAYAGDPARVNGFGVLLGGHVQYAEVFISDHEPISAATAQPVLKPWRGAGYKLILSVPLVPLTVPAYNGPPEPGGHVYQLGDYPDAVSAFRQGLAGTP